MFRVKSTFVHAWRKYYEVTFTEMHMADMTEPEVRHRHSRLVESDGVSSARRTQLEDADVYYPPDDNHGFFAKVSNRNVVVSRFCCCANCSGIFVLHK